MFYLSPPTCQVPRRSIVALEDTDSSSVGLHDHEGFLTRPKWLAVNQEVSPVPFFYFNIQMLKRDKLLGFKSLIFNFLILLGDENKLSISSE